MPPLMTRSMMKLLMPPRTISWKSPTLSLIHSQRPATPFGDEHLEDVDGLLHLLDDRLADELGHLAADVPVGQPEDVHHELEDPGQVERLRHLDAGVAERAEQPAHQPVLEVGGDVVDEAREARLDAVDEPAEEADRVGDDVPDDVRGLGQDVQQHVLELEDRLDDADDRVERLGDEAAVGRLQLVDARVERVAAGDVLLRELVDERVLLGVDVAGELVELGVELALGVLADLLEVGGQLRDVVADLRPALGDPHARGVELAADDVGDLADHRVHRGQVAGAALRVERVDLARHAEELVLEPAGAAEEAAVAVVLVGVHLRADVVLELLARVLLAARERGVDLAVEAGEDPGHLGLGLLVDRLDVGGDLGPLGLVLALGLPLVAGDLGQRGDLGALHALELGALDLLRPRRGPWRARPAPARGTRRARSRCAPWRSAGRRARRRSPARWTWRAAPR